MDINVSQILDFQRSELDWFYKYVRRRVRRSSSTALSVGTWFHSLMESYFKSRRDHPDGIPNPKSWAAMEGAKSRITMSADLDDPLFDSQSWALLNDFSDHWSLSFEPTSIIQVEQPFRVPLPDSDHFLIGIPDTIVTIAGKLWHLQHKTTATNTLSVFIAAAQRSLHELSYAFAISHDFGLSESEYGGTYLNIARKLSAKARLANPRSMFVQELIPLAPLQISAAISDISRIADRMQRIRDGNDTPIQNRLADTNPWGSALSPYFDVHIGLASLDDDSLFTDLETRYDAPEPSIDN